MTTSLIEQELEKLTKTYTNPKLNREFAFKEEIKLAIKKAKEELKKKRLCNCEIHKMQHSKHSDCPDDNCLIIRWSDIENVLGK